MSKSNEIYLIDLQLFAEGGTSGDGGTADGTADNGEPATPTTKGVKNPLADVKYGKQEVQAATVQTDDTAAKDSVTQDREAKFNELIKGEYKDLYDAKMQETVQKRLKKTKETVDKYNALSPMLEMLARKYGIDASDVEGLNKAIEEDDSYYEQEAMEKGITVEQLKTVRKMERENAELRRQMEDRAAQDQAERDVAKWMEEAKEAEKVFPGLDLRNELQNPQFIALMKDGIGLETAYFALHHRELVPKAMQYAEKKVAEQVTGNIIARGVRPIESGVSSQSSAVVKSDVSQLTKADRQEIIRRVARGEKIRF